MNDTDMLKNIDKYTKRANDGSIKSIDLVHNELIWLLKYNIGYIPLDLLNTELKQHISMCNQDITHPDERYIKALYKKKALKEAFDLAITNDPTLALVFPVDSPDFIALENTPDLDRRNCIMALETPEIDVDLSDHCSVEIGNNIIDLYDTTPAVFSTEIFDLFEGINFREIQERTDVIEHIYKVNVLKKSLETYINLGVYSLNILEFAEVIKVIRYFNSMVNQSDFNLGLLDEIEFEASIYGYICDDYNNEEVVYRIELELGLIQDDFVKARELNLAGLFMNLVSKLFDVIKKESNGLKLRALMLARTMDAISKEQGWRTSLDEEIALL